MHVGVGTFGNVGQRRLVNAVRRAADQHEAAVAVTAIDIAVLVDLEINARVAERRTAGNVAGAIAGDAGLRDTDDFERRMHDLRVSKHAHDSQSSPSARPMIGVPRGA